MFRKIRLWLYRRQLQKQLQMQPPKHKVMNMSHAKTVGILFDGTDESIMPYIYDYSKSLQSMRKKVSTLGFINANAVTENPSLPLFTRKQTDWLFKPNAREALDFMEQPFDILINVFANESATLEYISALSKAAYRVGPYLNGKTHCFDLMINANTSQPDMFLQQVNHYLEIISKHE